MSRGTITSREMKEDPVPWDDDDAVLVGRDDVSDFNEENILPEAPAVLEAIRSWLQPTPYDADNGEYRKHLASYLPGTGEWLLSLPTFRKWQDSDDQGVLWIKGIPGSGKSVIAASLVDKLSKEAPVLYFFFRQIIDANHKPVALLRDWLAQVLAYSPPLQARLKKYREDNRSLSSVSMTDMWRDLRVAMAFLPKIYCVVDALDEMDSGNDEFLQALAELGRWRPARVKVVMTSRPVISVERPLRNVSVAHIRLEEKLVDIDIAKYVAYRLHHASQYLSIQHRQVIQQAVPGRANGLFLYSKLAMDAFLENGADVQEVLRTLPEDLNVMYTGLLREHARRSGVPDGVQLLILSFVTHASRPLRLLEIAEMIRVTEPAQVTSGIKSLKELVRAACGPLLEILLDETACVIHHSLTEFLTGSTRTLDNHTTSDLSDSYPVLGANSTHSRLALACLTYLLGGCLEEVKLIDTDDYETDSEWGNRYYVAPAVNRELYLQYPFLTYSLENWHIHARKADGTGQMSEHLSNRILELLSGRNFEALMTLTAKGGNGKSPLHIAAGLGLSQYVAILTRKSGFDANVVDDRGETAIFDAAKAGRASVVKILLANGADADVPSKHDGRKPLHTAAANNHGEVVGMLLAAGVDPLTKKVSPDPGIMCGDPQKTVGHTPLMYAMNYGRESAAKAFLPYLKHTETVARALAWAAAGGHSSIVEAILQHSLVDVNARVRSETPLYLAAAKLDIGSITSLLKAGADAKILSTWEGPEFGRQAYRQRDLQKCNRANQTALHALCGGSYGYIRHHNNPSDDSNTREPVALQDCVSLMLQSGADVDAKDSLGMTALHYASGWCPVLVRSLLMAGADANITLPDGSTPLHGCRNPEIVRILVEVGNADINRRRKSDGKTPFLSIAECHTAALILQYADLGADLTLADYDGKEALHVSMSQIPHDRITEALEALDALLATGFSPNARDGEGKTPMHYLRGLTGDIDVVSRLVAAGADLNARDNQGRTPIFYFVKRGYELKRIILAFQKLLDLGARLDVLDHQGRNLLFAYVEANHQGTLDIEVVKKLQEHGVDVTARDHEGNTLLHEFVVRNPEDARQPFFESIVELGVDPDQQNHAGQSPLHFLLVSRDRPSMTRLKSFKNLDVKDNEGIRPLHVAAKSSEVYIETLLKAGASLTEPTLEGITPIHVAVRFRQPNIVGKLLETLEARIGKPGVSAYLNTFHRPETPTALHMACRAGVPQTVALLLAAGADPNSTSEKIQSPLQWCMQYEAEEAIWQAKRAQLGPPERKSRYWAVDLNANDSIRGIKLDDLKRDFLMEGHVDTRLEEILDMLCAYGADMVTSKRNDGRTNLDVAISECDNSNDYTVECLLRLRLRLERESPERLVGDYKTGESDPNAQHTELEVYVDTLLRDQRDSTWRPNYKVAACVYKRAATRRSLIQAESWNELWSDKNPVPRITTVLDDLLVQHDWDSIKCLLRHGPRLLEIEGGWKILSKLVSHGYVPLIRDTVTSEEIQQVYTERQAGLRRSRSDGQCLTRRPLETHPLLDACRCPSGNMATIRYLVEDLGIDVNDGQYNWRKYDPDRDTYQQVNSAISVLAKGDHWWQVAEGLPYLISRGADLERRDACGRTALLWTLDCSGLYRTRVARILIESGADTNAADEGGQNCLSKVRDSVEMTELLVSHGAVVSAAALSGAIAGCNAPVVEALLSAGADPNIREWPPERPISPGITLSTTKNSGLYPVFLAAMHSAAVQQYGFGQTKQDMKTRHLPIIRMLLDRGADPFAKFTKEYDDDNGEVGEEVVVLHEILRQGGIIQPFLELPNLNIEHRDPKGRTLLLSACGSQLDPDIAIDNAYYSVSRCKIDWVSPDVKHETHGPTAIKFLLDMGASIAARDNQQKNALHHILETPSFVGYESLNLLISRAPELLHQSDAAGKNPFHYALRRISSGHYGGLDTKAIEMLLEAGADLHQIDEDGNMALHQLGQQLAHTGRIQGDSDKPREIFKRFVSLGLPINGRNNKGETPVFSFLRHLNENTTYQNEEMQLAGLEVLADKGADFFAVNDAGETLLHVVTAADRIKWDRAFYIMEPLMVRRFRWLIDMGLDLAAEDTKGRTCLDVAAAKGHQIILKMYERPI